MERITFANKNKTVVTASISGDKCQLSGGSFEQHSMAGVTDTNWLRAGGKLH